MKIDKGIPVPTNRTRYNFEKMEIGDSMFSSNITLCYAAAAYQQDHSGFKFTRRKVKGGYRVWRIKA